MNHEAVYKFDRHKDKLTPTNMILMVLLRLQLKDKFNT